MIQEVYQHPSLSSSPKPTLMASEETLIEEREVEMVSPSGGKPSFRVAHFLKPSLLTSQESDSKSQTLVNFTKPITPNLKVLSSKVHFHGWRWRYPQKKWTSWVEKLRPLFGPIWKKSSIFEPIMASTLEIPRCSSTIFAFAERWCPETNSFLFPWGEVTITLEDIFVLGGYSVTGDSALSEISYKKQFQIEETLLKEFMKIVRSKSRKSSHSAWMDVWMENRGEFEHEAFLSLWLSRYVLPADSLATINKAVFQIAILLASGAKIALAPAVLASIYRDLRLLKAYITTLVDHNDENGTKLKLWAPFQLLQVWVWERFPKLSPKPNAITPGLPRLTRWNKVKILRDFDVGLAIDSTKESFRYRPYSTPLNNWSCYAKLYPEKANWVSVGGEIDLDLQSYVRFIRVSELVGLDSVQQYLPHRVAMQFGLDQDTPLVVPRFNDTWELAWSYYNRPIRDVKLYMPSRLFESDVKTCYLKWWKSNFEKGSVCYVKMEDEKPHAGLFQERLRIKIENNEADVPPGFESLDPKRKRVAVSIYSDQSSSKRSKGSPDDPEIRLESNKENASCCSSQVKVVESDQDDSDTDHLTLSQFFGLKPTKRLNIPNTEGVTIVASHLDSPLSSAEDNVFVRGTKLVASPSLSSKEREFGRGLENIPQSADCDHEAYRPRPQSKELDLEARTTRLQRVVDYFLPFKLKEENH